MGKKTKNLFGEWRDNDLDLLDLILIDKDFIKLVNKARKEAKLNVKRLPNNFLTAQIYNIALDYAKRIVDLFDLHRIWLSTISSYIVTGKLLSPGEGIYISEGSIPYNFERKSFLHADSFELIVTEKTSFYNVRDYLDLHKKEIKAILKRLPKRRRVESRIDVLMIVKQHMQQGENAKKIYNFLYEKDPNVNVSMEQVRHYIRRINQFLKGLPIT